MNDERNAMGAVRWSGMTPGKDMRDSNKVKINDSSSAAENSSVFNKSDFEWIASVESDVEDTHLLQEDTAVEVQTSESQSSSKLEESSREENLLKTIGASQDSKINNSDTEYVGASFYGSGIKLGNHSGDEVSTDKSNSSSGAEETSGSSLVFSDKNETYSNDRSKQPPNELVSNLLGNVHLPTSSALFDAEPWVE